MTAAARWRDQLEGWALPADLLDAVPWNPYAWPADLFARRDRSAESPPIVEVVRRIGPRSVLDIGAGTGGSCLALAEQGIGVTAVERDSGMAIRLREEAARRDVEVEIVQGSWPEVAHEVPTVDVATAAHVVHNVADLSPFLRAAADHARQIALQEFERHPWSHLGPYYEALHGLKRPAGPTVDDLVAVIREVFDLVPSVEWWETGRPISFADRRDLMAFYGRRLVLPEARWSELDDVLGPDIVEAEDGSVYLGDRRKRVATVAWVVA